MQSFLDETLARESNSTAAPADDAAFSGVPAEFGEKTVPLGTARTSADDKPDGAGVRIVEIPLRRGAPSDSAIAQFHRTVETLSRLKHPGFLPIHRITRPDGHMKIVMDLAPGDSLESQLSDQMQPWPIACDLLLQLAATLASLHEAGVSHGGLRPDRILIGRDGPILMDVGIALLESGALSGTPDPAEACMSPEQWGGQRWPVTPTMDVYSVGALLYRLTCGRYPFRTSNRMELLRQVLEDLPQPPRQLTRSIPPRLESLCLRCLARMPDDRPRNCGEIARELRSILLDTDEDDSIDSMCDGLSGQFRQPVPEPTAGPERFVLIEVLTADGRTRLPRVQSATVTATFEARGAQQVEGSDSTWMFRLPDFMHADDWEGWFANSAVTVLKLVSAFVRHDEDAQSGVSIRMTSASRDPQNVEAARNDFRDRVCRVDAALRGGVVTITADNLRFLERGLTRRPAQIEPGVHVLVDGDGAELPVHVNSRGAARPIVGRQSLTAMLNSRWEQACEGMGQILLIIGDEGMGKSCLIRELTDSLGDTTEEGTVLRWNCRPPQRGRALHPMLEWLQGVVGGQSQMSHGGQRRALAALLKNHAARDPLVQQLLECGLGLVSPGRDLQTLTETRRLDRIREFFRDWLRATAEKGPVLLVVEDLQWVDAATLVFLEQLVDSGLNDRILTLLSFRPEFETPWGSRSHQTQVALNRLTKKHVATLVESISGVTPDPTQLAQIQSKTGSIPLFIEHYARYRLAR